MNQLVVGVCAAVLLTGSCLAATSDQSWGSRAPRMKSRLFLGQQEFFIRTTPGGGKGSFDLEPQHGSAESIPWDAATRAAWDMEHPLVDVMGEGDRQQVEWQFYERWLPSLTGGKGAQKLTWRWNGTWDQGAILGLYSYENGPDKPRLVWESEPEDGMHPFYRPYVLAGDFAGDGQREIAVSRAGGISIIDSATGRRKAELTYRRWPGHHRYYGFFAAHLNPTGKGTLFVLVGIFSGHVDVVSYDGEALQLVWIHLFDPQSDQGIDRRYSIDRVIPEPVADVDGDGRQEILLSVFNDIGDQRWHVTGYDLLTGTVTVDLPDRYLCELIDSEGSSGKALLCKVLPSRAEPTYSPLEIVKLRAGQPAQVLWRTERARFSFHPPQQQPLDRWWSAGVGGGPDSVDYPLAMRRTAAGVEFYISRPDGAGEQLEAWEVGAGLQPRRNWEAELRGRGALEVLAVGPEQRQVLLKVRSQGRTHLELAGAGGEIAWSCLRWWDSYPSLTLVENGPGEPALVAGDVLHRLHLLTEKDGELRISKTIDGRLSHLRGEKRSVSPEAADLDGDGVGEVLLVRDAPDGAANLVALGLDGKERWSKIFPNFSGGGMTYWVTGRFRSRDRLDVAVTLARSLMHSDETFLLDGRTGQTIWHRDVLEVTDPPHTRAFGGGAFAATDVDGDGRDELILCYPAELSVTDGATGGIKAVYNLGPVPEADIPGGFWVIGGVPLTADLDADGRHEIIWAANSDLLSAFKYDHGELRMLWHSDKNRGSSAMPAVAHLAGGEAVIGGAGYPDGFRAVNGKDGSLRWSAPLVGQSVSNALAVDLGGKDGATFLFAVGNHLYARRADDGKEIWTAELPDPAVQVLFAEATGGHASRIVVSTARGEVVSLETTVERE
ncbi:MAG: PQQ-binding-like beta-propeller repeat protein [Armatimonadota bacterium]|nr:MAG: PQQ-binding-like beta-propeller repeat protein [Armatimonadota bacterium]